MATKTGRPSLDQANMATNKRILTRGGLLVLLLAALLFLPSPDGNFMIMLFDSLLLTIFAMLVIGTTGAAFMFVTLSAFILTVALPVGLLTITVMAASGGFVSALERVLSVLTDPDPLEGLYLVVPTLVVAGVAFGLGRAKFRLGGY